MDRQDIFNGLLDEFRRSELINKNYQLRKDGLAEHDASTLSRLLAIGELVLDMRDTFQEITLLSEEKQITLTVKKLRKLVFSQEEMKIFGKKQKWDTWDLIQNMACPQNISFVIQLKTYNPIDNRILSEEFPLFYTKVAEEFFKSKDYFTALASIVLSLKYNIGHAESHFKKGQVLETLIRYDEAIDAYKDALKFNPELLSAQRNLDNLIAIKEAKEFTSLEDNFVTLKLKLENLQADLTTAIQPLSSQQNITDAYENRIKEIEERLEWLRKKSQQFQIGLFITLIMIWLGLYWLTYPQDSASQQVSYFLFILSISSTTLLLATPAIWFVRRLHHDMKIERIVMEDIISKRDILLLRLLHSGTPHSPEAREMVAKNSHLVIAHNVDRGTADILQELYTNKPAKAGDDTSSSSHISQLVSAIEKLVEHIKPNK